MSLHAIEPESANVKDCIVQIVTDESGTDCFNQSTYLTKLKGQLSQNMKHLSLLDDCFKFSHENEQSAEDKDYRSALREYILRNNLMPSDRECSIQTHALAS